MSFPPTISKSIDQFPVGKKFGKCSFDLHTIRDVLPEMSTMSIFQSNVGFPVQAGDEE